MIEQHIANLTRHNDVLREIALNNLEWLSDFEYVHKPETLASEDFVKALYVTQRAIRVYTTQYQKQRGA